MLQCKDYVVSKASQSGYQTFQYILRVTENSVDEITNSSAVTVQAILKGSYSGLLFSGWYVGVSCSFNGEEIFSDFQLRRCEGTGEHIYFTWSGNLPHDEDGSLSVIVSGRLWVTANKGYLPQEMLIEENPDEPFTMTFIDLNQAPSAPAALYIPKRIALQTPTQIFWDAAADPEDDPVRYILERSIDSESFEQIYEGADLEYNDLPDVREGQTVTYRLTAVDSFGHKSASIMKTRSVNHRPCVQENVKLDVLDEYGRDVDSLKKEDQVLLEWVGYYDPDGDPIVFDVLIRYDSGAWEKIADVTSESGMGRTIVNTKAQSGQSVQLRITAKDSFEDVCDYILESRVLWCRGGGGSLFVKGCYTEHTAAIKDSEYTPYIFSAGQWIRHSG